MATPPGIEPGLSSVTGWRFNQLNYEAIYDAHKGFYPHLPTVGVIGVPIYYAVKEFCEFGVKFSFLARPVYYAPAVTVHLDEFLHTFLLALQYRTVLFDTCIRILIKQIGQQISITALAPRA